MKEVEIKNHTQSKGKKPENETTAISFQELGVSSSPPRVVQTPTVSKQANNPIINRDATKKNSDSLDEDSHHGSYRSGR